MSRALVYCHGACAHVAGYSNAWWSALQPFTQVYGEGVIQSSRYEVVWSDLIGHGVQGIRLCLADFFQYLRDMPTRLAILHRFLSVVQPLLVAGHELDVISHSEGTMVAYEALRMVPPGLGKVRNFFTVGSALGFQFGPLGDENVRNHLLPGNASGDKPPVVQHWWNLVAEGDPFGSQLKPAYPGVDLDYANLNPVGCGPYEIKCIHNSYFDPENIAVNREIFAAKINAA